MGPLQRLQRAALGHAGKPCQWLRRRFELDKAHFLNIIARLQYERIAEYPGRRFEGLHRPAKSLHPAGREYGMVAVNIERIRIAACWRFKAQHLVRIKPPAE